MQRPTELRSNLGLNGVDNKSVYDGRADEVALNLQEHEANRGSLDVVC
jgi:hypothetical protein